MDSRKERLIRFFCKVILPLVGVKSQLVQLDGTMEGHHSLEIKSVSEERVKSLLGATHGSNVFSNVF